MIKMYKLLKDYLEKARSLEKNHDAAMFYPDVIRRHMKTHDNGFNGHNYEEELGNIPSINEGPILDAGCSTGYGTVQLKQLYPENLIIGMDRIRDPLPPYSSGEGIKFVRGNFYTLIEEEKYKEYFAGIFVMNSLTQLDNALSLLEHLVLADNFHYALKEDGVLVIGGGGPVGIFRKKDDAFNVEFANEILLNDRDFWQIRLAYDVNPEEDSFHNS